MKRIYKSDKFIKYNNRHSKKLAKRYQMYKKWRKYKLQLEQGKPKNYPKMVGQGFKYVDIPSDFSFLSNTSTVLGIINKLRNLLEEKHKTYINLKMVEILDNGAITILLSIMTEFKLSGIGFNGNFPKNKNAKLLLISSGFFEHLLSKVEYTIFDEESKFAYGKENQIITKPGKKVISELAKQICVNASKTVGRPNEVNKGLYRTLIELMHNTNNHANYSTEGEEAWWLTVHHDKVNCKVAFVFMDFGVGIFNSLKNKPLGNILYGAYEKLQEKFMYGTDDKILKAILKGELHKTHTNQLKRGKGLPGIYEVISRNQICNFQIITNNVCADVSKDKYRLIKCDFNGTFLYWEINKESEVIKWKE